MRTVINHPLFVGIREEAIGSKPWIDRRAFQPEPQAIGALKPPRLLRANESMPLYSTLTTKHDIPWGQEVRFEPLHGFFRNELQLFWANTTKAYVPNIDDRSSILDVVTGVKLSAKGPCLQFRFTSGEQILNRA